MVFAPTLTIVAELRQQVRHVAVDGRDNARALEIHLRLAELGFGLRNTRLGAHALRLQRLDLPLRQIEVCAVRSAPPLLLMQLRRELLGILNGAPAVFASVW